MTDTYILNDEYLKLENTYITLPKNLFSFQTPTKVPNPKLVVFNKTLAKELGLNEDFLQSNEGIQFLCGNKVLEDTRPIAQAYAGHQFGHFTMLGDGRAILLGELISKDNKRFDIQIKGAGRTPYSRGGDGKAALGPMLREYIISEGMYALGIPTTRSLSVITTGEEIVRESFLEGAVLDRIAKSHIRVGTFQFARNFCDIDVLKSLADYTIERHFDSAKHVENPYLYLLNEVIKNQAFLISKWQLVGFIHGVMNTDNMLVSGETIDYGPCAFMDVYDPNTVFSSIDVNGRYAYGNQPKIGGWNLTRFAEALLPLLDKDANKAIEIAEKLLSNYGSLYNKYWEDGMRAKLGIFNYEEEDKKLISSLLDIMKNYKADYTNTFCNLTLGSLTDNEMFQSNDFKKWYKAWQDRLIRQEKSVYEVKHLMEVSNPTVIPRNYRVEEALDEAVTNNNYTLIEKLLNVIKNPYDYSNINEEYSKTPKPTYCGT